MNHLLNMAATKIIKKDFNAYRQKYVNNLFTKDRPSMAVFSVSVANSTCLILTLASALTASAEALIALLESSKG